MSSGKTLDLKTDIWNDHVQVNLVNASKYYINYIIVKNFYDFINGSQIHTVKATLKERSQEL
jgi:hypothetical protein